jgi:hypothetical protein
MIELVLANTVKATARQLDKMGRLPPPPEGFPDLLEKVEVAIDPQQSLHAMPILIRALDRIISVIGFQLVHNTTSTDFITSDNPVIYFDPDMPETQMRPYTLRPEHRRIELLLPISSRLLLKGHSNLRRTFAAHGIRHLKLGSSQEVMRINRLTARFGYRFLFASTSGHHELIQKYGNESPIVDGHILDGQDGTAAFHERVFGRRPQKLKWKPRPNDNDLTSTKQ